MFTQNWYKHLASVISTDASVGFKNLSGKEYTVTSGSRLNLGITSTSSYGPCMLRVETTFGGSGGVIFGTGTTTPTIEDYSLSGDLITSLTATASVTREVIDNSVILTGRYTVTNTGTDSFTIGEVAIITPLSSSYPNNSAEAYKGLLERTVLDAPVTIEAGGLGQVVYTIRINIPTT